MDGHPADSLGRATFPHPDTVSPLVPTLYLCALLLGSRLSDRMIPKPSRNWIYDGPSGIRIDLRAALMNHYVTDFDNPDSRRSARTRAHYGRNRTFPWLWQRKRSTAKVAHQLIHVAHPLTRLMLRHTLTTCDSRNAGVQQADVLDDICKFPGLSSRVPYT